MGIPLWPSEDTPSSGSTSKSPLKPTSITPSSSSRLRTIPIILPSGLTITVSRPETPSYTTTTSPDSDASSSSDSDSDDGPDTADSEAENNVYRALVELHRQETGGIPPTTPQSGDRMTLIEFLRADGRHEDLLTTSTASRPGTSSTITPQSRPELRVVSATGVPSTTDVTARLETQSNNIDNARRQIEEHMRAARDRALRTQAAIMAEARRNQNEINRYRAERERMVRTSAEVERDFELDRQRRAGVRRREERERMEAEAGTVLDEDERMRDAQAMMVSAMVQAMQDGMAERAAPPGGLMLNSHGRMGLDVEDGGERSRRLVGRLADLMEGLVMTTEGIQDICDALERQRRMGMGRSLMGQSVRQIERGVAGIAMEVERLVPVSRREGEEGENEEDEE